MTAAEELHWLERNLPIVLSSWERLFPPQIGAAQFRDCADSLYSARCALSEYLPSAQAKKLPEATKHDLLALNALLEATDDQLRLLADSLGSYQAPEAGFRAEDFRDNKAMNAELREIRTSLRQIIGLAKQHQRVLSRPSGGSGKRHLPQPGYYWPGSRAAGAEDR